MDIHVRDRRKKLPEDTENNEQSLEAILCITFPFWFCDGCGSVCRGVLILTARGGAHVCIALR